MAKNKIEEPLFIVAEISKNYPSPSGDSELLSHKFEIIVNVNHDRGYDLKEFRLSRVVFAGLLNETIIAVFHKRTEAEGR